MTSTSTRPAVRVAAGAAALVAGALTVLGAALALSSPAAAAQHAVVIKQYAYSPASMTIPDGDTVTWTNQDSVQHDVTVTAGPVKFHSPMLSKGQSWSHTFTTAGSYSYICSVHPDMHASVTVRPAMVPKPAPAQTKAAVPAPAAAPSSTPTARGHAPAKVARRTGATPAPAPAAAPVVSQDVATPVAQQGTTLDPLLLVAGASTAVTVFCLLLMTSRPAERRPEPVVEG